MSSKLQKAFVFTGVDGKEYSINYRHKAFCENYVGNGWNAYKAYHDIYHNSPTDNSSACKLLKKEHIKAYIEFLNKEAFDNMFISAEKIIAELAKVGFVPVESETVSPQVKVQALDKLAKAYGLYEQKKDDSPQEIHVTIEDN